VPKGVAGEEAPVPVGWQCQSRSAGEPVYGGTERLHDCEVGSVTSEQRVQFVRTSKQWPKLGIDVMNCSGLDGVTN
jgi:hypothetical protein